LEAFAGRGKNDYQSSHDLEDLMAVVDGRVEREFLDALPGYLLPDQASQGSRLDVAGAIEEDSGYLVG